MIRWLQVFALAVLGTSLALSAPEEKLTFYVQLIRGNNEDSPPVSGARVIGPKLSKSLHSVFKWKSYWEVTQREVVVAAGGKAKVSLSKEREVEIDLSQPKKTTVTAVSDRQPVCRTTQHIGRTMTIIGADRDTNSAWFVVVRRDKPSID